MIRPIATTKNHSSFRMHIRCGQLIQNKKTTFLSNRYTRIYSVALVGRRRLLEENLKCTYVTPLRSMAECDVAEPLLRLRNKALDDVPRRFHGELTQRPRLFRLAEQGSREVTGRLLLCRFCLGEPEGNGRLAQVVVEVVAEEFPRRRLDALAVRLLVYAEPDHHLDSIQLSAGLSRLVRRDDDDAGAIEPRRHNHRFDRLPRAGTVEAASLRDLISAAPDGTGRLLELITGTGPIVLDDDDPRLRGERRHVSQDFWLAVLDDVKNLEPDKSGEGDAPVGSSRHLLDQSPVGRRRSRPELQRNPPISHEFVGQLLFKNFYEVFHLFSPLAS